MTFLPIVERELREGARKRAPRYIRLTVAGVALLIGLFQVVFIPIFSRGASSGAVAFSIMTGYAFLLCIGAGVFVTADCLSEEKREGTLGLLFLTDLRGYDVVLGKLAAQLVHLGYALLAIIPAAALPLLLGGVTGGELWRISLALMNLLIFALAAGTLASSLCREAGRAMFLTAAILLAFCLGIPLLQAALNQPGSPANWAGWTSPVIAYGMAMELPYLRDPGLFWNSLAGSHAVAWAMIGIASVVLPRTWQDRPKTELVKPVTDVPETSDAEGTPTVTVGARRNRELLAEDPLLWLIGERKGVKSGMWALCVLWLGAVFISALLSEFDGALTLLWIGWIALFVVKVMFTFEACRFFTTTRRAGAFELLLATPINANRFIGAQWIALRRTFGPPLLAAVGGTAVAIALVAIVHHGDFNDVVGASIIGSALAVAGMLVQVLDFFALAWLGMWLSLTMKKPQLAVGATLLYVILLPWLATCYAGFVGFILDIILIAVFASKLHADFRQIILSRPHLYAATPK